METAATAGPFVRSALLTLVPAARAYEYHGHVFFGGVPVPGATVTVTQGPNNSNGHRPAGSLRVSRSCGRHMEDPDRDDRLRDSQRRGHDHPECVAGNMGADAAPARGNAVPDPGIHTRVPSANPLRHSLFRQSPRKRIQIRGSPRYNRRRKIPQRSLRRLLINGTVNNAATSPFTLSPAFGNRRPGSKGLYSGGLGPDCGQLGLRCAAVFADRAAGAERLLQPPDDGVHPGRPAEHSASHVARARFLCRVPADAQRDAATQSGLVPTSGKKRRSVRLAEPTGSAGDHLRSHDRGCRSPARFRSVRRRRRC